MGNSPTAEPESRGTTLLCRTITLQDSHSGDADGRQVAWRFAAAAAVQRDAASCRNSEIWEVAARRAALIAQEPSVGSSARASLPACRDALANAAAAAVCPPRTDGTVTTAGPLLRFPGLSNELRLSSSGSAPLGRFSSSVRFLFSLGSNSRAGRVGVPRMQTA